MQAKAEQDQSASYRVCLMGAAMDVGNLGVRALGASLVRLIEEHRPGAHIALLYGHSSGGWREIAALGHPVRVEVINYRLSPRARLQEHLLWIVLLAGLYALLPWRPWRAWLERKNRWLGELRRADLVANIHAGDSFSDIYGLKKLIINVLPDAVAILLDKPPVLLPQTYGPFKSRPARLIARWVLRHAGGVYARDREGLAVARVLLGPDRPAARFCPDVAFALEPQAGVQGPRIEPPLPPSAPLIGLNVSGLLAIGGYTRRNMFGLSVDYNELIRRLLARLLEQTEAHVLLVPHVNDDSEEADEPACRAVWRAVPERWRGRVHLLEPLADPGQIKAVIGRCDFFIGSRMHACIAAISQGVPALGVAYSRKFAGVFGAVGAGELVLSARNLDLEQLLARCLALWAQRQAIARELAEQMPSVRGRLAQCFAEEILNQSDQRPIGRAPAGQATVAANLQSGPRGLMECLSDDEPDPALHPSV